MGYGVLGQQTLELRRQLEEEQASYKRKLQAYQDGQQRQAQLVQKLQAKVRERLGVPPPPGAALAAAGPFLGRV